MIETKTLIRLARELCDFAVRDDHRRSQTQYFGDEAETIFSNDTALSQAQTDSLRSTAQRALSLLANSKSGPATAAMTRAAARWLNDPLVCGSHSMGVLSLSDKGRLQMTPHFPNDATKYAVTFADLIQEDSPALIKRCTTCRKFFVYERGARGQPRKLCDEHYEQSKQTKKTTTPRKPL